MPPQPLERPAGHHRRWFSNGGTKKLPSLTCHMLVSHLTTSFPSVSRTDDHGSPLWFWHTSIRFRIMTKEGLDHQRQRELGVDSSSPLCLHLCREKPSNLQFGSLHEELQPQHTPAISDCPAGSRHCSAQHRSS